MTAAAPGRVCPLRYCYGPTAIAAAPEREARTLYVIGGLYGNIPALDAVESMAGIEASDPILCFNGDFNWFDIAPSQFRVVNQRVLAHHAVLGNVEAEFNSNSGEAGCGCAYPETVDAGIVERSNQIHRKLKATARRHTALGDAIAKLPMVARYRVGGCRVGVVHGDAESLAGWRFDVAALDDSAALPWLRAAFASADVDVFASTHTCLPVMRRFALPGRRNGWVVNNGAAGMPNFRGDARGLCTRIGHTPSPHSPLHEFRVGGSYVALLPVRYDSGRWRADFLAQWPPGSPAWHSYFGRIAHGPAFTPRQALPPATRRAGRILH